jgi:membrane associated rhomboid family serine protease
VIPLPIRDNVPRLRFPAVTVTLIAINAVVWLCELGYGVDRAVLDFGLIPAWLLHGQQSGTLALQGHGLVGWHQELGPPWTILSSMFLHASWLHVIGNLWFLWIFGDNVEDALGRGRFVLFYFACGLAAAAAQVALSADSTIPVVGASGAIAGVLGGYALLYPRARVRCLWILFIFITTIEVPAWLLLGVWFLSQLLLPLSSGIAWMAHVGGFVTGMLLVKLLARPRRPMRPLLYRLEAN